MRRLRRRSTSPIRPASHTRLIGIIVLSALIHLAQSLVTPTAPVLATPDFVDRQPASEPLVALTARHPALFQARAPPIA
jgi:hypothetical protein